MITEKAVVVALPWTAPQQGAGVAVMPPPAARHYLPAGKLIFREESIKALLRTLSARDPYTGHHANRVTNIALAFARSLGLPAADLEALNNAGYLHDIGKIGISDAILLKPGPLNPEERLAIESHPLIGEKIVEPLGLGPQEKSLILLHHERWNGQGYPHGLEREQIPFLCRLLALADVFDALTSDRPYRRAFSLSESLAKIEAAAGAQFDPDLTGKFVHLIRTRDQHNLFHIPPPPWLAGGW